MIQDSSRLNEVLNYSPQDQMLIKAAWLDAIEKGRDAKKDFDATAREVKLYYSKRHDHIYTGYSPRGFWQCATIAKTYEGVKILGSFLHQSAPVRRVEGKAYDDQLAEVIEQYEDYAARELDLRRHGRLALEEALLTGKGVLITELDRYTGLVYSRYECVDNMLVDPDTAGIEDCWWVAFRCCEPKWLFERKYGAVAKDVNGTQDAGDSAIGDDYGEKKRDYQGSTQNLVSYWKIFSKMGAGLRMQAGGGKKDGDTAYDDYKFIIIAPGVDRPVFIGPWPTPYWADTRSMGWPNSDLAFARVPGSPWPMSIFGPAMPLQKWIDWAYSFLLRKVATTSRDIVVMPKRLDEQQRAVVLNEAQQDLEALYVDDANIEDIRKVFATLQFPQMNGDLLTAISMAEAKFREITGLHEILSGITEASYRSAEEARVKDRNSRSRVEDMNQEVEVWHSHAARKEAIALRYHYGADPQYIYEILGEQAAQVWQQYGSASLKSIMREYSYTIEEGSMRRLNPQVRAEQAQSLMDMLYAPLLQTGSYDGCNNIVAEWCKSNQIKNPERFFINTTVIDGQVVTPEQQRQMLAEQEQMLAQQQQVAAQEQQAAAQAGNANDVQLQMVESKNQADLIQQQMKNDAQTEKLQAGLLEKMLSGEQGGI